MRRYGWGLLMLGVMAFPLACAHGPEHADRTDGRRSAHEHEENFSTHRATSVTSEPLPTELWPLARKLNDNVKASYPVDFFAAMGLEIVPVSALEVGGLPCSGTVVGPRLYAILPSSDPGQQVEYQLTLHHELSHALFSRFRDRFPTKSWMESLPSGIKYEGVTRHIRMQQHLRHDDLRAGMLRAECYSSMDEDFAVISEELMRGRPVFWLAYQMYPALKLKVDLAVSFYHDLHPDFSIDWFRAQEIKLLRDLPTSSSADQQ